MDCPVDFIKINENKARLTAFFVLVLTLVYLRTGFWLIMAFLMVDFALRTFNLGNYSLLGFISDAVIKQLNIKNKPVDRAPKRFAAGVGLVFTAAILVAFFLGLPFVPMVLAVIMALFAMLESFFGFCAGCYVYDFGRKITLFK
jgi:hypothetical protein